MHCSNCGGETTKRICQHCGAKTKKQRNNCIYCGRELSPEAVKCVGCGQRVYKRLNPFLNILWWLGSLFFVVMALVAVEDGRNLVIDGFALAALIFIPPVFKRILNALTGYRRSRNIGIFAVYSLVLAALLAYTSLNFTPTFSAGEAGAVAYAKDVVRGSLKNPDSLAINESLVTMGAKDGRYQDVTILLDTTAQNGFGGSVRQTVRVECKYDTQTGEFSSGKAEFQGK